MKAVVFQRPGHLQVEDRPIPQPKGDQVRLRVQLAGICMTDYHILQGHFPVKPPRVLGHEIVGKVDGVGPGVTRDWIGRDVAIQPAIFCWDCFMCCEGLPQLCLNFQCLGNTHDGGFAEYTLARVDQLVPLEGMCPDQAVWLEPLACVLKALARLDIRKGSTVLVSGAGTLGRLTIQALRAMTDVRIAVVDPNLWKVDSALTQGAEVGWQVSRSGLIPDIESKLMEWSPLGPRVIFETTGRSDAIERSIAWVAPGGQVLLFGVSDRDDETRLSYHKVFARELSMLASTGMTPESFTEARQLILSAKLDTEMLVWKRISLEKIPSVMSKMGSGTKGKVLVQPGNGRM